MTTLASSVETVVRDVIGRVARTEASALGSDDDLVEQLGVDSLQGLQILARVEQRCGVRLPDEELIGLRTVARIVDAVERARQSAGGA